MSSSERDLQPAAVGHLELDLKSVFEALVGAAHEWYNLGLALDLEEEELRIIREEQSNNNKNCLRETISRWLRNCVAPKWECIVQALCSPTVNCRGIAQAVQRKHCPYYQLPERHNAQEENSLRGILKNGGSVTADSSTTTPMMDCKDFSLVKPFRSGASAPGNISRPIDAVLCDKFAYFRGYRSRIIHVYDLSTSSWSTLPECRVKDTSLVVIANSDGLKRLHTIGGLQVDGSSLVVGTLYCLRCSSTADGTDTEQEWVESSFSPLNEKRKQVTAVSYENSVIAAGGRGEHGPSRTVEVLNLTTKEWSFVASLPRAVFRASGCICGDYLYILGGCVYDDGCNTINVKFAHKATLSQLIQSRSGDLGIFCDIAELPKLRSACATVGDKVFAIGGSQYDQAAGEAKSCDCVYVYHSDNDLWMRANRTLTVTRCYCFCVGLMHPGPQLMVVGGYTSKPDENCTNSVEIIKIDSSSQN